MFGMNMLSDGMRTISVPSIGIDEVAKWERNIYCIILCIAGSPVFCIIDIMTIQSVFDYLVDVLLMLTIMSELLAVMSVIKDNWSEQLPEL